MTEPFLNQKKKAWAYARWCEGSTQDQIAEALGTGIKTVQRYLSTKERVRPILTYPGDDAVSIAGEPKTGSISQLLEEAKEEICNHYCKYPYEPIPEGKDEDWLWTDPESPCQHCPLDRL